MSTRNYGLFVMDDAGQYVTASEDHIISCAKLALELQIKRGPMLNSPPCVKDYLTLKLGNLDHEVFCVVFMDAQHRVIECQEMFRGTLTQCSVYAREVVKEALKLSAASVIFSHNHPSGTLEPSRADELLTQSLKSALQMVDVRVLDHIIVGAGGAMSFAERGLL